MKPIYKIGLIAALLALVLYLPAVLAGLPANASVLDDLKAKIDERNRQIDEIQKEIERYQAEIDKNAQEAASLKKQINALEITKKKLSSDIKLTQKQIESAKLSLNSLDIQIEDKEEETVQRRYALGEILKSMNSEESTSLIEIVMANQNLADFFGEIERINNLQKEMNINLAELKALKEILEERRLEKEKQKNNLQKFSARLTDQKQLVEINAANRSQLLNETKNKESLYRKLYEERLAAKEALEREIFDYESELKFILDPASLPAPRTNVFSWPLERVYITQEFGATVAARRLYTSGSHNGVDFRASIGTPVKAMLGGTVLGAGNTDITCAGASFGKWILIRHQNGLASLYAHLSLIKVNKGEDVSTGQIIGYSGNTGYSTGPHLHVTVYAGSGVKIESRPSRVCGGRAYTMPLAPINAYLDPLLYLPPYNNGRF